MYQSGVFKIVSLLKKHEMWFVCDSHQYYILALAEETQLFMHISGIASA